MLIMQTIPMRKKIYLTFDCGYENGNTPLILDALKKHQAPAVFFVVGNFISDNPDLIKRIVSEGHIVGNHTMTHPDMSGISSLDAFRKQLNGVAELYESVTGEKMTKFYRPPQGVYSTSNLKMAKDLGYTTFFLESCLCRLDTKSAAFKRRSLSKAAEPYPSRCHRTSP